MGKKSKNKEKKSSASGTGPVTKKAAKKSPVEAAVLKAANAANSATGTNLPKEGDAGLSRKERTSLKDYHRSIRAVLQSSVDGYKKDIDPDKYAAFKKETIKIVKGGAKYFVLSVAVSAILLLPELYFSGKVLSRTNIAGVSVGRLTPEEAKNKLMVETEQYLKTPITFTLEDKKISMSPQELGAQISLEQTLNTVPIVKFRESNPLLLAAGFITKRDIPLQYALDKEAAIGKIEDKLDLKPKRAANARLVYTDKNFQVEPEKQGVALDRDLFAAALSANIANLKSNPINLSLTPEQPRITAAALSAQKDRLVSLVKNDLNLKHGDKSFIFKTNEHLDAIEYKERTALEFKNLGLTLPVSLTEQKMEIAADSPVKLVSKLEIAFNKEKIQPFLQENLIKDIEIPTSAVTISKKEDGNINIEGKGEDGRSVPSGRLVAGMNLAVNRAVGDVPVPVVTEKAPVTISGDLQALGIRELLATGHSSYYGSPPNRMHNIDVGITKYNGVLVKPGEEFSFNKLLGEVDAKSGYLPEKVIKKNKAEYEYGGGICQVSTTLYRAALFAGVPITERNPHSWKVSYYGQVLGNGLDATIYLGVSDVKFINDTPSYLLIQSYAEGANAYFKFYGTSDGRTVAMDGPIGGGLHYKWYRTIKKNGEEIKETIVSNYKPIPPPDPPPEKKKEVAQAPAPGPTL